MEVSIAQDVIKLAEANDSTNFVRANQRARALATEGDAGANRKDPGEYVTARADLISVLKDIQDSITRR